MAHVNTLAYALLFAGFFLQCSRARRDAREQAEALAALAAERGANAVIGVRFDTADTGHDMSELVAHGTAAIVEQGAQPPTRISFA
jgi:uncharacterized protein YbjQ (UPF0145 family)